MLVWAKVCELTDDFLWFVCGNLDVSPYPGCNHYRCQYKLLLL